MSSASEGSKLAGRALALDLIERAVLVVLFGAMSWSFLRSWEETGNEVSLILLISEGSIVAFVLIRRCAAEISLRPVDWLLALLGTVAALLARPTAAGALAPAVICLPLMLTGLMLQISAKLTLRRSFGAVPANRGVKIGGPYALVRHPMYAGYLLTQIGFLLTNPSLWNALVYTAAFSFQIGRLLAEERLLNQDAAYRAFAGSVRFRLIPGLF